MTSQSNSGCCGASPWPQQWMAYASGVANKDCQTCDDFNSDYTFNLQGGIQCAHWYEATPLA